MKFEEMEDLEWDDFHNYLLSLVNRYVRQDKYYNAEKIWLLEDIISTYEQFFCTGVIEDANTT